MARCPRCDACRGMFEPDPCYHCNFPLVDNRTPEQKKIDDDEKDECPMCGGKGKLTGEP